MAKNHKKDDSRGATVDRRSFICVLPDHPSYIFGEVNKDYWMHVPPDLSPEDLNKYYKDIIPLYEESLLRPTSNNSDDQGEW